MAKIPALNECEPGLDPVEYNVLILPEPVEEKTAGGIIRIEKTKDADELAAVRGRLVAVSPFAFSYEKDWPEGSVKPEPGDIVVYARYSGSLFKGADGRDYRLCKDKDVCAIVRETVPADPARGCF